MKKITIAIDGYSSTGKSTVAKQLAKALGYAYVDSGAMYRAVTLFAMQHHLINETDFDSDQLISQLENINISFQYNDKLGFAEVYLNGQNVEKDIRSLEVSNFVSPVSAIYEVRKMLVKQQQQMGKDKAVVMDGRDIGTVVFPDAELKIFMNASADTRAKRRYHELLDKGVNVNFDEVLFNVMKRDSIDTSRKDSPLKKAEDAIEFDNSNLTEEEQFQTLLGLAEKTIRDNT
jgi:cytidylate kinase